MLLTALPATRDFFPQILDHDAGGGGAVSVALAVVMMMVVAVVVAVAMSMNTGNISSCVHSHRASSLPTDNSLRS